MNQVAEDPVVRASRREAVFTVGIWFVAMAYTLTYCYCYGYGRRLDDVTFVLWFPDWVFWGIVVPWLACILVSTWFAFGFMGNESLGPDLPEADPAPVYRPPDDDPPPRAEMQRG